MNKKYFSLFVLLVIMMLFPLSGYAQQQTGVQQSKKEQLIVIKKITVRDISIDDWGTRGLKAIKGEVKNHSDKTLKQVEVTLYAFDKDKKSIYELKTKIIDAQGKNVEGYIKPNYTRKFTILFDPISDWSGEVEIKVTNVKLLRE